MILMTPDLSKVGPCDLVTAEARSLPAGLVARISLLERVAELARAVLEDPLDTDTAGGLAELLRSAGYPLREEADVSHGNAPVMGECVAYQRHELFCTHPEKETRWQAADGCSGTACRGCTEVIATWPSDDKVRAVWIDRDGIPLSRDDWTSADHIGHLIRTTERGSVE